MKAGISVHREPRSAKVVMIARIVCPDGKVTRQLELGTLKSITVIWPARSAISNSWCHIPEPAPKFSHAATGAELCVSRGRQMVIGIGAGRGQNHHANGDADGRDTR